MDNGRGHLHLPSILYHDSIYHIKKNHHSNELMSSLFFEEKQTLFKKQSNIDRVSSMIKATERHFEPGYEPDDGLAKYFLDLDLMQLCVSDIRVLIKDNENIDKEFYTEYETAYVHEARFNFLKDVMKPNACLRALDNPILQQNMDDNIKSLITIYGNKSK